MTKRWMEAGPPVAIVPVMIPHSARDFDDFACGQKFKLRV
jgi:hypothetical protein